jgi:hypothetical protein
MSKKLGLVFTVIAFLLSYHVARAEVVINEVQLSSTSERFLELYNSGSEAVDLTGWYMQRKTETGTSFTSLVSKTNFENQSISAGGYFVVSRASINNSDVVLSTLTLTESNTIQIKNLDGEIVDVICWGSGCGSVSNPTEGKSIQRVAGSWIISAPTPGSVNQSSSGASEDDISSGDSDTEENISKATVSTKTYQPKVQITSTKLAHVGVPFMLQGTGTNEKGEKMSRGKYYWNFGDGDFREVSVVSVDKFFHTYFYPGDYTIVLDHYPDSFTDTPDASAEFKIKVIEPKVIISAVGNSDDFFIELENQTGYSADLSGWALVGQVRIFTIPKNTILASKAKMIIPPQISGLTAGDTSVLRLITREGELIYEYGAKMQPPKSPLSGGQTSSTEKSREKSLPPLTRGGEEGLEDETAPDISPEDLQALALPADSKKRNFSPIIPITSFLFISGSAGAVYLIRRQKSVPNPANDFEILDE